MFLKSEFTCQFSIFLNIHDLRRCYIIILRNNLFIFNFIIMSWKENGRPSKSHMNNKNKCYTYLNVFLCFEYFILIRFISIFFKCSYNTLRKALWKCTHKIQFQFNLRIETKKIRTLLHETWPVLTKNALSCFIIERHCIELTAYVVHGFHICHECQH
jgi:hypothetical protein